MIQETLLLFCNCILLILRFIFKNVNEFIQIFSQLFQTYNYFSVIHFYKAINLHTVSTFSIFNTQIFLFKIRLCVSSLNKITCIKSNTYFSLLKDYLTVPGYSSYRVVHLSFLVSFIYTYLF
jgi:hypothetical protein